MRHLDDGLLQAWLDRPRSGLEPGEYDRIERHLASCEACAGRVAELRDSTRRTERLLAPAGAADEPVPPYGDVVARARRSGARRQRRRGWMAAGWAASVAIALWGGWLAHGLIGPGSDGRSADRLASAPAEAPAEPAERARESDEAAPADETTAVEATAVEATGDEATGDEAPAVELAAEAPALSAPGDRPETQAARGAREEAPVAGAAAERLATAAAEQAPVEAEAARAEGSSRPRIVQGRVTSESGRPLAAVQVAVEGSSVGSLTGPDGRFTLDLGALPDSVARDPTVTAILLGYRSERRAPGPEGGDTASLDFRLEEAAVALSEIVVTGTTTERAFAAGPEAERRHREREDTPPAITVPRAGGAPAEWLPVRRADAESRTGLPLLLVPGLEVVSVETARFDGLPVVRVVQALPGGEHLTLIEAAGPVTLDGLPPREDLAVSYTRTEGVWITGIAALPADRLEALLERIR